MMLLLSLEQAAVNLCQQLAEVKMRGLLSESLLIYLNKVCTADDILKALET